MTRVGGLSIAAGDLRAARIGDGLAGPGTGTRRAALFSISGQPDREVQDGDPDYLPRLSRVPRQVTGLPGEPPASSAPRRSAGGSVTPHGREGPPPGPRGGPVRPFRGRAPGVRAERGSPPVACRRTPCARRCPRARVPRTADRAERHVARSPRRRVDQSVEESGGVWVSLFSSPADRNRIGIGTGLIQTPPDSLTPQHRSRRVPRGRSVVRAGVGAGLYARFAGVVLPVCRVGPAGVLPEDVADDGEQRQARTYRTSYGAIHRKRAGTTSGATAVECGPRCGASPSRRERGEDRGRGAAYRAGGV